MTQSPEFLAGVRAGISACIEACMAEYLGCHGDPDADPTDISYDTAIGHCVIAIRTIDPKTVGGERYPP